MIMKRKAQIRMSESIAILFVFFILVVFGFIFYSKIEARNFELQKGQVQDLRAVEVAQTFSFLPEIQCTKENVATSNCFDIMKLEALQEYIGESLQNEDKYYDKLLRSSIVVKEIYPSPGNSWTIYNKSNFAWTRKIATQIPISLFNATGDPSSGEPSRYYFGALEVEVYS